MLDALTRRRMLGGVGAVSAVGAAGGVLLATRSPSALQIDVAAARHRDAKAALADAIDRYEAALPPPHPSLDMTHRRPAPFFWTSEQRIFDRAVVNRAVTASGGLPTLRLVATSETIERDLGRHPRRDRARRRLLYRMRRRAKKREAFVAALEERFRLADLEADAMEAQRDLHELVKATFAERAVTIGAVLDQARALEAHGAIEEQWAAYQAGGFGRQLAVDLQQLGLVA